MRIISQKRDYDIPYEQVVIEYEPCERGEDVWYSIHARTSTQCFPIAKYTTESKAKKAMEMLSEAYCGIVKISKEITDIEIKQIVEDIKNGFYISSTLTPEPKVECKYFQFPADEEIEVID